MSQRLLIGALLVTAVAFLHPEATYIDPVMRPFIPHLAAVPAPLDGQMDVGHERIVRQRNTGPVRAQEWSTKALR